MKKITFIALFSLLCIICFNSCKKKKEEKTLDCSTLDSAYSTSIKSIISGNCNTSGCHNAGSINGDFTTYTGLQSKANNGTLRNRVLSRKDMPPSGALSQENLDKIKCWIDNGAPNN